MGGGEGGDIVYLKNSYPSNTSQPGLLNKNISLKPSGNEFQIPISSGLK